MNVAFEKWIPVVLLDGTPALASLAEVMTEGNKFADLSVRPHERVSLMRLFLCVAHAALDGPEDYDDWKEVPDKLPGAAAAYLEKWKDSFELFHPEKPWLQVRDISKNEAPETDIESDWGPVSKLGFFMATGNNTTLFDHDGMNSDNRHVPLEETVVSLLTFQCFSTCGLIPQVFWNGKKTEKSAKDSPCVSASMIHSLLRGENLLATIHLNLPNLVFISKSYPEFGVGRPIWEIFPESHGDAPAVENATRTYLGRLVPIARLIRLNSDMSHMLMGAGLVYPSFVDGFTQEPTATTVVRTTKGKQEWGLLSFRPGRAIWRELGGIVVRRSVEGLGGPLSLQPPSEGQACDLIVSALARVPGQQTIIDTTECVYHIPARLREPKGISTYEKEVKHAEFKEKTLGWAVSTYREEVDGGWKGRLETAGPKKGELLSKLRKNAQTNFWTAVERELGLLMNAIDKLGTAEIEEARGAWRKMLSASAYQAYAATCGQATPREMKAYALGLKRLQAKPKTNEDGSENNEEVQA